VTEWRRVLEEKKLWRATTHMEAVARIVMDSANSRST
jgi:hypothetical protein